MWNPVKIEFENLFAHKHSAYEFKNDECVVIFGRNETDRNLDNNGAGKTTLFEAICIALTNDSLRAIKKDTFINDDADECKITFELYNAVLRMKLLIRRTFYRSNKPVRVEIYENDVLNTQITCVNDANKRVLELLGISREDLLRYYIVSQDNQYTFFTASDSEKKEIMNRITSADMINPVMTELIRRFNEVDDSIGEVSERLTKASTRKETLEEQLEKMKASDDSEDRINSLKQLNARHKSEISKLEETRTSYSNRLKQLEQEIAEIKVPDTDKLREERKATKKRISELEDSISENERAKRKLNAELEGKVVCPKCGEEFLPSSDLGLDLKQIQDLIKDADEEIANSTKRLESRQKQLDELNKQISEADAIQEKLSDLKMRQQKGKRMLADVENDIEDFNRKIKRNNADIEAIKNNRKNDYTIKNLTKSISECNATIKAAEEELVPLNDQLNMIQFWQFNMGKSGFMTYLANKSIKIIEGVTNSYLRKFGVDISVLINGFKILKSGEVREKIDVFVTNDGVNMRAFMGESGGERGRVTLAGILGIQRLINMSTNGKGLNLLLMDECFHGMDSRGQENIIKIFERMGSTIMVITQNVSDSFNNENTLYVVKENGESRYIS